MSAIKITLRNDFHSRQITLQRMGAELTSAQIKRVRAAKLCPYIDCTCGGPLGVRPSNQIEQIDHDRYII